MSQCLNPDCLNKNPDGTQFCQKCGSKLLLRERYRAIKLIGQGGFGKTFLAIDSDKPSKPQCVIKQFFPQALGTETVHKASELFEKEAVRLDDLGSHPQIPELLAYFTQDERQYLVQEFIDGQNLEQELAGGSAFNEAQIRSLLNELLPVLEFIHEHQVIHRDIKPENIIRRRSDNILFLVDFGASKYATRTALAVTGTVIGSQGYIAPEQAAGKATFVSDIYSLGVTCIHLLTKVEPFELFDVGEGEWAWRNYLTSPVSDDLGQILDKMLQGATKRRYQEDTEVLQALNRAKVTPTVVSEPLQPQVSSTDQSPVSLRKVSPHLKRTPSGRQPTELSQKPTKISPGASSKSSSSAKKLLLLLGSVATVLIGVRGLYAYMQRLENRQAAILDSIERSKTDGNYLECISQAKAVPDDSPISEQTQALLNDCQNAHQALIHLAQAKKLAENGQWFEAIAKLNHIPSNSSSYQEAQKLLVQYNDQPLISRVTGVNYTDLRDLLAAGKWREADQKNTQLMLKAAGRESEGWFSEKSLQEFSCNDLKTIDRLWVKYSDGRFGFSVQKDIFLATGNTLGHHDQDAFLRFADRIGWRKGGWWLHYDLTYNLNAPAGHLPADLSSALWLVWRYSFCEL